jgi:hypothetical protein
MKGTIDPVEAIFTAVSGLWGRVFSFLAACWLGYALGFLAAEDGPPEPTQTGVD